MQSFGIFPRSDHRPGNMPSLKVGRFWMKRRSVSSAPYIITLPKGNHEEVTDALSLSLGMMQQQPPPMSPHQLLRHNPHKTPKMSLVAINLILVFDSMIHLVPLPLPPSLPSLPLPFHLLTSPSAAANSPPPDSSA